MALRPGTQVGPYRIDAPLGAGGMGEVYRATDTKLGRDVAIKIVSAEFADAGRLARFEREARMLAALNHPHIATLFGWEPLDRSFGEAGGTMLVMELVDGPTLETKLSRGALPLPEVLRIATQIADAVGAAHDQGIVHRDLKPANIKLTSSGAVKVLDFGIAKTMEAAQTAVTATVTEAGQIVGTSAYMSPEQTRGVAVDSRTDVWAFGCVLFEMLTGRRAFDGATRSDISAAVLQREPDWVLVPANTPPALRVLVRRCLQKEPSERFRSMSDARIILDDLAGPGAFEAPSRARPVLGLLIAAVSACIASLVTWYAVGRTPAPAARTTKHFTGPLESASVSESSMPLALSPDGTKLVVSLGSFQGAQLYLRSLDRPDLQPIPGTVDAFNPFFSPDGEWIGFFTTQDLRKVPVAGGPVVTICRSDLIRGGAVWGPDGLIYFTPYSPSSGVLSVPSAGGEPAAITTLAPGETSHRDPDLLPGGRAILFTVFYGDPTRQSGANFLRQSRVVVRSLDSGEQRTLIEGASFARYVPSGHIVYAKDTMVFAVPFDVQQLTLTGTPAVVSDEIAVDITARLAVSSDGTLAYVPRRLTDARSVVWVDRQGTFVPVPFGLRSFETPRLSPDGTRIAAVVRERGQTDVWVQEPTGALSRLTFDGVQTGLIWTPNGAEITFSTLVDGKGVVVSQEVDGARPARVVVSGSGMWPGSWSRDGRTLAFMENVNAGDIRAIQTGESKPTSVVSTPHTEWGARLSPDDRWMAYTSNDSGRWEVYVTPYPGPGARRQISASGGSEVVWARNGRELFYRNGTKLMAVDIQANPTFSAGTPRVLFDGSFAPGQPGLPGYDVSLDSQRFLMVRVGDEEAAQRPIHVVLGWLDEVRRLSAAAR